MGGVAASGRGTALGDADTRLVQCADSDGARNGVFYPIAVLRRLSSQSRTATS